MKFLEDSRNSMSLEVPEILEGVPEMEPVRNLRRNFWKDHRGNFRRNPKKNLRYSSLRNHRKNMGILEKKLWRNHRRNFWKNFRKNFLGNLGRSNPRGISELISRKISERFFLIQAVLKSFC